MADSVFSLITYYCCILCIMEIQAAEPRKNRIRLYILIAMVAGIAVGYSLNGHYQGRPDTDRDYTLQFFSLLADIFLRLVKMIIAPLVFTTLAVGVARQGSAKAVGRIGGKTLLWFITFAFISLALGLVLVNFFQPGAAMHLALPDAVAASR